jgi:hypothetical protein
MSLAHIKDRREPTIFGGDLNVNVGDTTINGNVVVQGSINGTSSANQNTNNTWTGTNEFASARPVCSIPSVNNPDGVNFDDLNGLLLSNSVINRNATWTDTYSFTQDVLVEPSINTSANDDAVTGKYLTSQMNAKLNSFLSSNNVWTGTNTFSNSIPTRNTNELSNLSAVTKQYVDTSTRDLTIGNATSIDSQTPLNNYDFGTQHLAHQLQILGGGGGSYSSNNNVFSAGGGASSCASIILLTYSPLATSLGITSNLARFNLNVGIGGLGQTTQQQIPTDGSASTLSSTSTTAYPLTSNILNINGGKSANPQSSLYSNVNPLMVSPYTKINGLQGKLNGTITYQQVGINQYGAGAEGVKSSNGKNGFKGGYTITSYKI